MSRSYKKSPYIGHCKKGDKDFKQGYNRKIRSRVKQHLRSAAVEELDDLLLPEKHIEFDDVWNSRNDGKPYYIGDMKSCRTQYNMRFKRVRDDIFIDQEFVDDLYGFVQPEVYDFIKGMFDERGPFDWYSVWYDVVDKTLEEEVKSNNEYYKKYMRK